MAYVITEPCIGTKDSACVDVCPVDCIHPRKGEPAFESATMLNIHPDELAPLMDGMVTGTSTAIGAFIPIVPFLVFDHQVAMWTSLSISMLAHFGIGAARSIFTGRSVWASGRDMFFVGFGVAAIGYLIGDWVTRMM